MIDVPCVCIQVQSIYVESQSIPEGNYYVFAYAVTLRILGCFNAYILGYCCLMTNRHCRKTEVQGIAVISEQLLHQPGREFQYTSGIILKTPLGTMENHYEMVDYQSQSFRCAIPVFHLTISTLIY